MKQCECCKKWFGRKLGNLCHDCESKGLKVVETDWKARAEKAEAELAEADRVLAIHKRDYEVHFKAHQEEFAKREKALNYLYFAINYDDPRFIPAMLEAYAGLNREESIKHAGIELVEGFDAFAEWLKQRNK